MLLQCRYFVKLYLFYGTFGDDKKIHIFLFSPSVDRMTLDLGKSDNLFKKTWKSFYQQFCSTIVTFLSALSFPFLEQCFLLCKTFVIPQKFCVTSKNIERKSSCSIIIKRGILIDFIIFQKFNEP